jgi:hypothetical protein
MLVQLVDLPLLLFVQLSLLVQLASKGKRAACAMAAAHSTGKVAAAREAAYRVAAAREADTQAATPRAATWSLV